MNNLNVNQTLPQEYKQYPIVTFCSNTFVNLKYLIEDKGFIPFLLGNGDIPRIWIYAKKENNPIVVVRDSVAILPGIKVNIFNKEKKISVEFLQMTDTNSKNYSILEIDFSKEQIIVNHIDLRPVGYNVYGDIDGLNIGEQKFHGKIFENINSLLKIETITSKI